MGDPRPDLGDQMNEQLMVGRASAFASFALMSREAKAVCNFKRWVCS